MEVGLVTTGIEHDLSEGTDCTTAVMAGKLTPDTFRILRLKLILVSSRLETAIGAASTGAEAGEEAGAGEFWSLSLSLLTISSAWKCNDNVILHQISFLKEPLLESPR